MKKQQSQPKILGVLLANGPTGKPTHQDRCLRKLMGRPVLHHIIEQVHPQVSQLILNANGDPTRFSNIDIPIVPDAINDHPGLLSGILTGMEWAHEHMPDCEWIASFSTSSPLIPDDLVQQLLGAIQENDADMAYISCNGRKHPEYGLWPVDLAEDLRYALEEEDIKQIDKWCGLYNPMVCPFTGNPIDPFGTANVIDAIIHNETRLALH
ncbi:MAG: NTP transferase domain-containing protein [Pseudomonadales bacterium]|jgi:molybdopterin-guanine dinucleotide biosynthesis protein A